MVHVRRFLARSVATLVAAAPATGPTAAAFAADEAAEAALAPSSTWVVRLNGREVGRETVTVREDGDAFVVESKGSTNVTVPIPFEQRLDVARADGAFVRNRLEAKPFTGPQTIEAEATESGVRVEIRVGGEVLATKTLRFEGPVLCLENLVLAHYEVLGREALRRGKPFEFTLLVPQKLVGVPACFDPGPIVEVRVEGASRAAREGTLVAGGVSTTVVYDAESGRPYRVAVPSQSLEADVEGVDGIVEGVATTVAASPDGSSTTSPTATPKEVREVEVTFESSLGPVPGTLARPASGAGPFAAVVFLHGSGPHDRDESIGPNKPFRDLAHGLAAGGVATLRFEKRTMQFGRRLAELRKGGDREALRRFEEEISTTGLREESVIDGVAAIAFLRTRPEIRSDAIFVLGHSLGALAAPEVADEARDVRGLVLLAGPGRSLVALLEEQMTFQRTLGGEAPTDAAAAVRKTLAPLRLGLEGESPGNFLGGSFAYWRDVDRRSLPDLLRTSRLPVLLLQGEADVQVRRADYDALLSALDSRRGVAHAARLFPGLNHLFMRAPDRPTGAEYYLPGAVDPTVIEAIVGWLKERS